MDISFEDEHKIIRAFYTHFHYPNEDIDLARGHLDNWFDVVTDDGVIENGGYPEWLSTGRDKTGVLYLFKYDVPRKEISIEVYLERANPDVLPMVLEMLQKADMGIEFFKEDDGLTGVFKRTGVTPDNIDSALGEFEEIFTAHAVYFDIMAMLNDGYRTDPICCVDV